MTGIDWNAAAKQMGITDASHLKGTNATGTVSQSGAQVSTPSFQGGLQLAPQPAYDQYQPSSSSGGGVVAGLIGTAVVAGAAYLARKGSILKHGKFGGSVGDWIRNIGKKGKDGNTLAQYKHLVKQQKGILNDTKAVLGDAKATSEAKEIAQKAQDVAKESLAKLKNARYEGKDMGKIPSKAPIGRPSGEASNGINIATLGFKDKISTLQQQLAKETNPINRSKIEQQIRQLDVVEKTRARMHEHITDLEKKYYDVESVLSRYNEAAKNNAEFAQQNNTLIANLHNSVQDINAEITTYKKGIQRFLDKYASLI